jgi:outer membrane protein assembly factor BamD
MLKGRHFILLSWLVLIVLFSSCNNFRKIQKSGDWELKYRAALEYYDQEEYFKASTLFEEIIPILRGRPEAERVQFYFAYSHYYQKQYLLSSHYFQTFYTIYSRSELAEEAMYMHAYSLFLDSPEHNLDQTSTYDAINAMQTFLNTYPNSGYKKQANQIIDQLQVKLEEKAYKNAIQYYRLEKYHGGEALKAALISFDNFQKEYPDSELNEDISFFKIECSYKLAKSSIRSRQRERLMDTIDYYEYFIDNYPSSSNIRDAENIYIDVLDDLEKLARNNL